MITILNESITNLKTDAVVNAANAQLLAGGGVCGAIFRAAGRAELQKACNKIGGCATGSAVITPGFNLKAKYIIHAVGPVWQGGTRSEEKNLCGCYTAALRLAKEHGCKSIAFPLISSGIYGYPVEEAWRIAIRAAEDFLAENPDLDVIFADIDADKISLGQKILAEKQPAASRSKTAGKYTFFWNVGQPNEEFSNWYPAKFTVEGIEYSTVEQYMMAKKALVFQDLEHYVLIMNAGDDPAACKNYGRAVRNFDSGRWSDCCEEVVYNACCAKFLQNPDLAQKLLATGDSILAEASPYDKIWGIGLGADNPDALDPSKWQGQNLMGKTLMRVRDELYSDECGVPPTAGVGVAVYDDDGHVDWVY